jgi:hypothetical protein
MIGDDAELQWIHLLNPGHLKSVLFSSGGKKVSKSIITCEKNSRTKLGSLFF